jgi:all-trans-retinol 13,14-reductase
MKANQDYDAIVIGSGLGGLTAAACLATNGLRTLVAEQHEVAGGCTHTFRRDGGYEFDVGLHYVGDCDAGGSIPQIHNGLGLAGRIEWLPMDADRFDTLVFPEFTFEIPRGWDRFRERLVETFPNEEQGIRKCLRVLERIGFELGRVDPPVSVKDRVLYPTRAPVTIQWGLRPLGALFDACKLGPGPRAVIAGQALDHSASPSRASVLIHAAVVHHYVKSGGFYPKGGGQVVAARLVETIHAHGGEVRTRARVERILVRKGRAEGIRLQGGNTITAPVVVSNADIKRTFFELIGREHLGRIWRRRLERFEMALPLFVVYAGLDIDLRDRMPNTNYWCFDSLDTEAPYAPCRRGEFPTSPIVVLSSGSRKDPATSYIAPPAHASIELMTVAPPHDHAWDVRYDARIDEYVRGPRYREIKERIVDDLLRRAANTVPGLGDLEEHVVFRDAASPIDQARFTLSTGGACYGIEHSPLQSGPLRPRVDAGIDGLYLAGASTTFAHGIHGATRSGVAAAGAVLGRNLLAELREGAVFGDPSRLPTDDPDWDPLEVCRTTAARDPASAAKGGSAAPAPEAHRQAV